MKQLVGKSLPNYFLIPQVCAMWLLNATSHIQMALA